MIPFPPFPILFEDDHFVVISKPPKILVHRTKISEDQIFVLQLLRKQLNQRVYPVHRLDRATSGALVFGKSKEAAGVLGEQFREHNVEKKYLAIIRGYVASTMTIDYPLSPEPHKPKQEAITHFKRLGQVEFNAVIGPYPSARYSLVDISIDTGRRHQIRKHFSHLRHPIIGDKKHGDIKHNKYFAQELGINRLLLHAKHLSFTDFSGKETISVEAPLDADFRKALDILGFNY